MKLTILSNSEASNIFHSTWRQQSIRFQSISITLKDTCSRFYSSSSTVLSTTDLPLSN